eukprot:8417519-Alexandrium_andersonii.AAC.1
MPRKIPTQCEACGTRARWTAGVFSLSVRGLCKACQTVKRQTSGRAGGKGGSGTAKIRFPVL